MKPDRVCTEIGAYDAKTRLPELLRQVEAGARFRITHRGRPIADLVPTQNRAAGEVPAAIDQFLAFSRSNPLHEDVPIKEWIEDGRE